MVAQAKAYLANPSASMLAQLQNQVVTFQQQVNGALLHAARIVDPNSQPHALAAIQAVGTIVVAILSLVAIHLEQSASGADGSRLQRKTRGSRAITSTSRARREIVAAHYGEPIQLARMQVAQATQAEIIARF